MGLFLVYPSNDLVTKFVKIVVTSFMGLSLSNGFYLALMDLFHSLRFVTMEYNVAYLSMVYLCLPLYHTSTHVHSTEVINDGTEV